MNEIVEHAPVNTASSKKTLVIATDLGTYGTGFSVILADGDETKEGLLERVKFTKEFVFL